MLPSFVSPLSKAITEITNNPTITLLSVTKASSPPMTHSEFNDFRAKGPFSLNSPLFTLDHIKATDVKKCSQLFIMRWTSTTGVVSHVGIKLTLLHQPLYILVVYQLLWEGHRMWFLVLVLTSSKVYNLWPGHASPLQTAVRQIMFVAQKCFVSTSGDNVGVGRCGRQCPPI